MDISAKKLAKLLASDIPNIRASALVVAGELGMKDADIAAAVLTLLDDKVGNVRIEAVRAAGKLKLDKAIPTFIERIGHGGLEGELSAKSTAMMGSIGVKALQELMHKVVPGVRKYIAAALAETGIHGSEETAFAVFHEPDGNIAEAAAHAIAARISEMTESKRKDLAAELVKIASAKKQSLPKSSEGPVFRLLAALNVPATSSFFWERTQAPYHSEVRAISLQTVGGWIDSPTKDQWKKLFTCACESNFQVVGPALLILEKLPFSAKQIDDWMPLFSAPDVAARRLAVQKLGDVNSPAIAEGLLAQLNHHDRSLKDAARARLTRTDAGRKVLAESLLKTESVEEAWSLARTLAPASSEFSSKLKDDVMTKIGKDIEANCHLADPLLFLMKESDPIFLRDGLFDRAVEYRKKKKFEVALPYLKLLGRDPAAGYPVRLELACVGLKLSKKELGRDSRINDSSLSQFAHAANADMDETIKQLQKAKWIEADELYYIGFHFAEDMGRLRQFGAACLKLCIERSPKGKTAQNAKTKLKTIAA